MNDLMQKLAISKKIMDKHGEVPRNGNITSTNPTAKYNIPEGVTESPQPRIQETITTKPINEDAVMKSKLPDEIKRLMIENPIVQPNLNGPTLSEEVIEGATRLMNGGTKVQEEVKETNINGDIKQVIRDVVRDTVRDVVREELSNAGLISESTQKTNETLSLRVGKHVFEGKVTKIKKIK